MENHETLTYNIAISNRIKLIMEYLGLEIAGFEEFTGVSSSQIYAILNGNRKLTGKIADQIGEKIGLEGWKIFQLEYTISPNIRKTPLVIKFHKDYSAVTDYFIDTRDSRKQSHFIEQLILTTNFFDEERYVWEVIDECKIVNRIYTSKELSQILKHFCDLKILNKEKRQFRSRNGHLKSRIVYVFFKPKGASNDSEDTKK